MKPSLAVVWWDRTSGENRRNSMSMYGDDWKTMTIPASRRHVLGSYSSEYTGSLQATAAIQVWSATWDYEQGTPSTVELVPRSVERIRPIPTLPIINMPQRW